MKYPISAAIVALSVSLAALADAQELGSRGDAIFSADRLMAIAGTHRVLETPVGDQVRDWTSISFGWRGVPEDSPFDVPRFAFDYLLMDHLSVGGSLGYASIALDEPNVDATLVEFSPRVGFLYSFGRVVAIWPRGGFTYHSASTDPGPSSDGFAFSLECPFTFSPTPHFAFHVGPTFDVDFAGEYDPEVGPDQDLTHRTISLSAGILGWL